MPGQGYSITDLLDAPEISRCVTTRSTTGFAYQAAIMTPESAHGPSLRLTQR